MLNKRVEILNRTQAEDGDFGLDSGGVTWEKTAEDWAAVDFVKGIRAMREGASMPTAWCWCVCATPTK